MDYCNSSLVSLPRSSLDPYSGVQNAAARLIFQLRPRNHVMPSLIQLHWQPVRFWVPYKLCMLMHYVHIGRAPAYLTNSVQAMSTSLTRSSLRSASTTNYVNPRLRTTFCELAFSHAVQAAWNALPSDLRSNQFFNIQKTTQNSFLFLGFWSVLTVNSSQLVS